MSDNKWKMNMADKNKNLRMGRPKKEFNLKQFEKLCGIQATKSEIAHWFDMSEDTVENKCAEFYQSTFSAIYKKFSEGGKISLRRAQFKKALDGNVPMLIWLGKQVLGQKDKAEFDPSEALKGKLVITSDDNKSPTESRINEFLN